MITANGQAATERQAASASRRQNEQTTSFRARSPLLLWSVDMAHKNPAHAKRGQNSADRRGAISRQLGLLGNLQRSTNEMLTQKLKQIARRKIALQREILVLSTPLACKKAGLTENLDEMIQRTEKAMAEVEEALDAKLDEICKLEQDLDQAQTSLKAYRSQIQQRRDEAHRRLKQALNSIPADGNRTEVDKLKSEIAALLEQKKAAELQEQQLRAEIQAMKSPAAAAVAQGHEEEP